MSFVLYGLFAILVWLNIASTYQLLHAPFFERRQKIWQFALIWLVPLIGASMVMEVIRGTRKHSTVAKSASASAATPALVNLLMLSWIIGSAGRGPDSTYSDTHGYDGGHHSHDSGHMGGGDFGGGGGDGGI